MLKDITRVEKIEKGQLRLHKDKGEPRHLSPSIWMLHLSMTDIALRNNATVHSKARTHEGQDLHGILGAGEHLRQGGSLPFFDVESVTTYTTITGIAHCEDRLYLYEKEAFQGRIERVNLRVHAGSPARAVVHALTDEPSEFSAGGPPLAQVDVILEREHFDSLFKHLWISPTPATIRVAISLPCHQHPMAGSAPGYAEDVLLRSGVTVAQIDDVSIEKRLSMPAPMKSDDPDEVTTSEEPPADPSIARLDAIRKATERVAGHVKRLEFFAGLAIGIVIISALLR